MFASASSAPKQIAAQLRRSVVQGSREAQVRYRSNTSLRESRRNEEIQRRTEEYLQAEAARTAERGRSGVRREDHDGEGHGRDTTDQAESSSTPWLDRLLDGQSQGREASSRSSGGRFDKYEEEYQTPDTRNQPRQRSIAESFESHWRDPDRMTDRPRVLKGVHNRVKRAEGSTPAEASAMDALIDQMLRTMPMSGSSESSLGSGSGSQSQYGASADTFFSPRFFQTPIPLTRSARPVRRLLERPESEEDAVVLEILDGLKEEMGMCRTDVDLIEWAKEKVFRPIYTQPLAATESAEEESGSDISKLDTEKPKLHPSSSEPNFSPVYPRILAHLLSYVRRNFNNPHLVLALFHHAQTSSPESYLSGCLAPAYNEVLKTRWESFRDLEGVETGIREMEMNGVAWDRGTSRTVNKIVDEVGKEVWQGTGWQEKYGADVHVRLARLEDRLQRDINEQNKMYEAKKREKADIRYQAKRAEERREHYDRQDQGRQQYASY